MFCWVIVDKDTGDIEHCYYDTGPGASERRQEWLQGEWPIRPESMPENLFAAEITEEDLISAMADEKIGRFADNKNMLKMALQMDKDQKVIDAKRIREEFKAFQDRRCSAGVRIEARSTPALIDIETGNVVENSV